MSRGSMKTPTIAALLRCDGLTADLVRQRLAPELVYEELYEQVHAGSVQQVVFWVSPADCGRLLESVAQLAWTLEAALSKREPGPRVLHAVLAVSAVHQLNLVKTALAPLKRRPGVSIFYAPSIEDLRAIAKVDVMVLRFPTAGGEGARPGFNAAE